MKYTPEEMQALIEDYFRVTDPDDITITGLALHLDTTRVTLCEYEKRPEFVNTIKKGKERVALAYELRLVHKGRSADIFALKNMGWTDRSEVDQNVNLTNIPKIKIGEQELSFDVGTNCP